MSRLQGIATVAVRWIALAPAVATDRAQLERLLMRTPIYPGSDRWFHIQVSYDRQWLFFHRCGLPNSTSTACGFFHVKALMMRSSWRAAHLFFFWQLAVDKTESQE